MVELTITPIFLSSGTRIVYFADLPREAKTLLLSRLADKINELNDSVSSDINTLQFIGIEVVDGAVKFEVSVSNETTSDDYVLRHLVSSVLKDVIQQTTLHYQDDSGEVVAYRLTGYLL